VKYPVGTLDLVQIQNAIYDWIKDSTHGVLEEPLQIVWRNQGEPVPPRPFVGLKLISGPSPTDRDPNVFLNAGSAPIGYGMQMEGVLSVQVYGNTKVHRPMAYQLALDLNSSLLSSEVRRKLKVGGVSIQGLGKPQNMSAVEESQYEERAGFEIELGMVQNITDKTTVIEQVNIHGTVNGEPVPAQSIPLS
jgi:hypothetical protein